MSVEGAPLGQGRGRAATSSRRALVRGAAWSLPVVAVASAAPAVAASPCLFEWTTKVIILSGGRGNELTRDKHEPVGTGDCSDLSVDYWLTRTVQTGSGHGSQLGEALYLYVPHFRVIVGTQISLTSVSVVLRTEHPVVASTLNALQSPAAGATPAIYKVHALPNLPKPEFSPDGREVVWSLPSMPAQCSVQYQVDGEGYVMTEARAQAYRYTMTLSASGMKECGAVPLQCPPRV